MWENGFRFCVLPDPPVQALDYIGSIDNFSDFHWIIKELSQRLPIVPPGSDSISLFVVPLLLKIIQSHFRSFQGGSIIDFLHVSCKLLFFFPDNVSKRVADLVYNADLSYSIGEYTFD